MDKAVVDSETLNEAASLAALGEAGAVPSAMAEAADAVGVEEHPDHSVPAVRVTDRRFTVAALLLIMVLASMEMTVTSTAMPTIIGELHGLEHYSWVATLYLLACTVTMPLYGRLADVLGRKKVILGATFLFTAGSVMAAMSHGMVELILYRGVQGLGAGGIMPVVLTIMGDMFTLKERARMQGMFSAVWGTSALAGPAFGAFLVHTLGWRWVFLVNLPFGFLGLLVLAWKYHDLQKPHSTDLDLPGITALAVGSIALLSLVSGLGPDGWDLRMMVTLGAITLASFLLFIWVERRTQNPVMPPSLMLRRDIGPCILAMVFFGAGFLALDTYVPLYIQGGRGGGAGAAAGVVTPVMMTWALSNVLSAPLLLRWGFRTTALIGCVAIVIGFGGLFTSAYFVLPRLVMTGVLSLTGFGFGFSSMSYLLGAQDAVDWNQRGIVTSTVSFCRTIGGSVGVGLLGAMFNFLSRDEFHRLAAEGVKPAEALDPKLQATFSPAALARIQHAISGGLLWVFAAMLGLAIVQLAVTFLMRGKKLTHGFSKSELLEAAAEI